MLVPPERALTPEAYLIYGGMGAMKTTAWCQIRKWYEVTGTPGHFHVLCTEWESVMRCAEEYTDGSLGNNFFSNCTVEEVTDYSSLVNASKKIHEVVAPKFQEARDNGEKWTRDFIVCDSLSDPQLWSRDVYFGAEMNGMSYSDFAQTGRSMLDVPSAAWGRMRGNYLDWFNTYVLRFPGHRFCTARSKKLDTTSPWANSEKNAAKRRDYGHIGYFPVGYDEIGHPFHSVIYAAQTGPQTRTMTTAKDRARAYSEDLEIRDFVLDWMIPGGWQFTQDS